MLEYVGARVVCVVGTVFFFRLQFRPWRKVDPESAALQLRETDTADPEGL